MATPTGQTGSVGADSNFTTDRQILGRIAAIRKHRGLPADRESDRIWLRRIKAGGATIGDARTRIEQKAVQVSKRPAWEPSPPPPSGPAPAPDPDVEQDPVDGDTEPENPEDYAPHWMKGELLDVFVGKWSETGRVELAIEAVRKSGAYDSVFLGNRREDGSLRFGEQEWFSQRDGFREIAEEFGAGGLDNKQIKGLFQNDVDAREFARGVTSTVEQLTAPGAKRPEGLLNLFVDEFAKGGSAALALEKVRDSGEYAKMFPGIRREDGSLVMDERAYFAHREGMRREFAQRGLNPQMFESHHPALVQGEVSLDELRERLNAKVEGVMQNLGEVRQRFGRFYGIDAMNDNALIAAALDPQIGLDLLQGRITAAQVSGEAELSGFDRGRQRSEFLAQAGGLDQRAARQLFSSAAEAVPRFDRFGRRFNDKDEFGIEDFEDASVFGSAEQQQRMRRLQASEEAMFRRGGQVRRDDTGLTGLRRR